MRLSTKSWARLEYEIAYRHWRLDGDPTKNTWHKIHEEIWRAADYSYQGKDYEPHAWSTVARLKRFHQILWRVRTARKEFPS